jgi:transitional endoplasmic reticulum ATPase
MLPNDDSVRALRAALAAGPENPVLRRLLASLLSELGRHDEAATELRLAVGKLPDDVELRLDLARCYGAAGKASHGIVVLEALQAAGRLPAQGLVLLARLQLVNNEWEQARSTYTAAVEADASVADTDLAQKLALDAVQEPEDEDGDPVVRLPAVAVDKPESPASALLERPTITFADVGGMQQAKDEISIKILQPLLTPELFAAYGKKSGGGVLMYGPPGCGKTLLARATAGELKGRFLAVGIHDVLDAYLGSSERNLHALFEEARRNTPCVLFFDEVDALGGRRSDHGQSFGRTVVNQFLAELDGSTASNEGVLVLGATNAPWQLDSAFRRPGRFDRVLFVPPPDLPAREAVLRTLLAGKPQERIDLAQLAKRTEGFSGADLKAVVDRTVEDILRRALGTGKPDPVKERDLLASLKEIAPSTREWFASARNYALFSNQGGTYDDLVRYLKL